MSAERARQARPMPPDTRAHLRELRAVRAAEKRRAARAAAMQAEADAWNAAHPPRVPVVVTLDSGAQFPTFTRSAAWVVCGHVSILVDGISGGYLLSRCRLDLSRADVVVGEAARNLATAYHPHTEAP